MSFFANVNQTATNDDDTDQPPASGPASGAASGTETPQTAPEPKPKAPRKRKPDFDENGNPIQKRKRRSRAEM